MGKIGIVSLSFGILPDGSPGESNIKLASLVDKYAKIIHEALSYVQHEVSSAMETNPHFIVWEHPEKDAYLDSDEVLDQISEKMRNDGVTEVILFAHLFFHRFYCRKLLEKYGFKVKVIHFWKFRDWWIPFCKKSTQWWTRNPAYCIVFVFLHLVTGRRGH